MKLYIYGEVGIHNECIVFKNNVTDTLVILGKALFSLYGLGTWLCSHALNSVGICKGLSHTCN